MTLKLGNGASVAAKAKGSTSIDLYNHVLLLEGVLYVPIAYKNIISRGYEFLFSRDECKIYFGNKLIGIGYLIHGLYYIDNISNNKEPQIGRAHV